MASTCVTLYDARTAFTQSARTDASYGVSVAEVSTHRCHTMTFAVRARHAHDTYLDHLNRYLAVPDVRGVASMDRRQLEHLKWLNDRINFHCERIYLLKQRALPSAVRYKSDKTASAMTFDQLGELFGEIDIEERKVTKLIDQYHAERTQAIRSIRKLDNRRERNILYLRYISFMSWDDVEKSINTRDRCSRSTIMRLHNQALKKLE